MIRRMIKIVCDEGYWYCVILSEKQKELICISRALCKVIKERKNKELGVEQESLELPRFPGGLQFRKCSLVIFLSAAGSYATQSCITIPTKQRERERESRIQTSCLDNNVWKVGISSKRARHWWKLLQFEIPATNMPPNILLFRRSPIW